MAYKKKELLKRKPPKKKSNVKKAYLLAKAMEKGKTEGSYAAHMKKPLIEKLDEHLGHIIDNSSITDWVSVVAAIGITPLIHEAVLEAPKVLESMASVVGMSITGGLASIFGGPFGVYNVVMDWIKKNVPVDPNWTTGDNPYPEFIYTQIKPGVGMVTRATNPDWTAWNTEHVGKAKNPNAPTGNQSQAASAEILSWLLAFSISYMIIRFGDKLLASGVTASFSGIMGLLGVTSLA